MTKQKQLQIIDATYDIIVDVITEFREHYHFEYLNILKQEETQHNKNRLDNIHAGLTRLQSIKLFYVKRILEALTDTNKRNIKDYISTKPSVFYAASLVENLRVEFESAFMDIPLEPILAIDYAQLMQEV